MPIGKFSMNPPVFLRCFETKLSSRPTARTRPRPVKPDVTKTTRMRNPLSHILAKVTRRFLRREDVPNIHHKRIPSDGMPSTAKIMFKTMTGLCQPSFIIFSLPLAIRHQRFRQAGHNHVQVGLPVLRQLHYFQPLELRVLRSPIFQHLSPCPPNIVSIPLWGPF